MLPLWSRFSRNLQKETAGINSCLYLTLNSFVKSCALSIWKYLRFWQILVDYGRFGNDSILWKIGRFLHVVVEVTSIYRFQILGIQQTFNYFSHIYYDYSSCFKNKHLRTFGFRCPCLQTCKYPMRRDDRRVIQAYICKSSIKNCR